MELLTPIPLPKERRGPSPSLKTLHEVERILRLADASDEGPLPLGEIRRRMKGSNVRHSMVRACVDELTRLHLVTEDPRKGAMWTFHEEPLSLRRKRWIKL